jgi:cyclopropane fatty-acyl-phospholipid synthase-like methyltransferase
MTDHRAHAPATARNREPILAELRRILPPSGLVLEVSAGTGEHAVFFAAALPHLTWQPTDLDERSLLSIAAHREGAGVDNLRPPLMLDAASSDWPVKRADAIVCINMIHIAPWSACAALLEHAERWLAPGAPLVLYGPFKRRGEHTAPSNAAFDAQLRSRDPEWGVRDLDDVVALARERFELAEAVAMPANNLTVVLIRR